MPYPWFSHFKQIATNFHLLYLLWNMALLPSLRHSLFLTIISPLNSQSKLCLLTLWHSTFMCVLTERFCGGDFFGHVSPTSHFEELVYWISWNKVTWFGHLKLFEWYQLWMWESECGIFIWSCSHTVMAIKMCYKSWCQRSPWVLIDVIRRVRSLLHSFMAKTWTSLCLFFCLDVWIMLTFSRLGFL